ncbi:MAG: AsmA-like C-terminal domain-containing protein, partial [Desulfuromonadales bacterium]|nr:AsmA-like C-terminal domain-containing protein [Desulfuromonadales bacterium]
MISVNHSWDNPDIFTTIPNISAALEVSGLDWDLPDFKQLRDLSVNLSLDNNSLKIKKGILIGANHSFFFSGKIDSLFQQPQLDFELNFNSQFADFAHQFNLPKNWELTGSLPGAINLTGSLFDPTFILQADLSSIKADMGIVLQKKATDSAKIYLRGHLGGKKFQLDQLDFNLKGFKLSATGYFQPDNQQQRYYFRATPIELEKLQPFSPLLQRIQLSGTIEPEITQQTNGMQAKVKLHNGGAHIISFLGDIENTSGEIILDQHGFSFKKLKASLGESPFIVDGVFSNWRDPLLVLDLNGKKVRAQDIVFSNRQLTLYDLTGQLRINAHSISFSPIKVRLEDDTVATVKGNVKFRNPLVDLDITAEKVDVLDIINLFVDNQKKVATETGKKGPPLHIKIAAKQGVIGGLKFKNATGLIGGEGNRLIVYPLEFENGDGWCKTRIEYNYADTIAPLKISGHAVNIDASVIHQDIFKKRGLISGSLQGDFYIEGNPQHNLFWQEAKGGIHLKIKDGTLRKFHSLAKIFSLLNVSQIFTGNLPDMDKEGMPFTLLEGSLAIGDGKATINDLKVTSVAMNLSVVGSHNLVDNTLDFTLGVMPLRTVDKVISVIPLAGWILTGEDKALIT